MHKIANTNELQTELSRLLAYAQSERPSRTRIASALEGLSERVAGAHYASAKFVKVRFTGPAGETAGIVLPEEQAKQNVQALSKYFPSSEARKMEKVEKSQAYATFEQAFNHEF